MPAPETVLAGLDFRLAMIERAVACALDAAASPGTVYVGLLEAAGELREFRQEFRPTAGILKALAREVEGAVRASVLAEQAAEAARAEAEAARPALRLVAGLDGG